MIKTLHEENQIQKDSLSDSEIEAIREGLKNKWDDINKEYQKLTHIKIIDTIGLKTRK